MKPKRVGDHNAIPTTSSSPGPFIQSPYDHTSSPGPAFGIPPQQQSMTSPNQMNMPMPNQNFYSSPIGQQQQQHQPSKLKSMETMNF